MNRTNKRKNIIKEIEKFFNPKINIQTIQKIRNDLYRRDGLSSFKAMHRTANRVKKVEEENYELKKLLNQNLKKEIEFKQEIRYLRKRKKIADFLLTACAISLSIRIFCNLMEYI